MAVTAAAAAGTSRTMGLTAEAWLSKHGRDSSRAAAPATTGTNKTMGPTAELWLRKHGHDSSSSSSSRDQQDNGPDSRSRAEENGHDSSSSSSSSSRDQQDNGPDSRAAGVSTAKFVE
jgi:hypothetical protein